MSDHFSHAARSIALSSAHDTRLYPHDDESLFFFESPFFTKNFQQLLATKLSGMYIYYPQISVEKIGTQSSGENWDSEQLRNSSLHSRKVSLQNLCKVCMTTKHILLTT